MRPFGVMGEALKMIGEWQECIPVFDRLSRVNKVAGSTSGGLYNEVAFHYLLKSEFHRSQRSDFGHYVLLLSQGVPNGGKVAMSAQVVGAVVMVLSRCLRETDYIGWYREGRVVGGVLTTMGKESGSEQIDSLQTRIIDALRDELGSKDSSMLRIRICAYSELAASGEQEWQCGLDH